MTKSGNNSRNSAKLLATNSTVNYCLVATVVYAIGSNIVFNNCLAFGMTKSGNNYSLTAGLCTTNGTVGYVVVRTVVYTVGINVVFNNYVASLMTLNGKSCINNSYIVVSGVNGCGNCVNTCYGIICISRCDNLNRISVNKSVDSPCELRKSTIDMDVLVIKSYLKLLRSNSESSMRDYSLVNLGIGDCEDIVSTYVNGKLTVKNNLNVRVNAVEHFLNPINSIEDFNRNILIIFYSLCFKIYKEIVDSFCKLFQSYCRNRILGGNLNVEILLNKCDKSIHIFICNDVKNATFCIIDERDEVVLIRIVCGYEVFLTVVYILTIADRELIIKLLDYKKVCIHGRNVIRVGYDTTEEVVAGHCVCYVVFKGNGYGTGDLVKDNKKLVDVSIDLCNSGINSILTCDRSKLISRDNGDEIISVSIDELNKLIKGYTVLKYLVGSEKLVNPLGKINVNDAIECTKTKICDRAVYTNSTGDKGVIGLKTINCRSGSNGNSMTVAITINLAAGNINAGIGGKDGKKADVCADCHEIKELVEILNLKVLNLLNSELEVMIIELDVRCNYSINTCMNRKIGAEVNLTIGLHTNVVNVEPLVAVCKLAVYINVKYVMCLVVKFYGNILVAVFALDFNVNSLGNDSECTNDRHCVVELIAPKHAVCDLYVYAIVLDICGVNPKVSLNVAVYINGKEVAAIGVDTEHEVLDCKTINVAANNRSALIHAVPCGKADYVVINRSIPLKLNLVVLGLNNKISCGISGLVVRINRNCTYDVYAHVGRMEVLGNDLNLDINDIGNAGNCLENLVKGFDGRIVKTKKTAKTIDKL